MNWKKRFPELAHLESMEILALVQRSGLSKYDRKAAINCLCWGMTDIESSVDDDVRMDRSTVGKRLREIIVPELVWLDQKPKPESAAGA